MQLDISFIIILVMLSANIIDNVSEVRWVAGYFRHGIPIYRKNYAWIDSSEFESRLRNVANKLSDALTASIIFKGVDVYEYAFQEKMFHFQHFSYATIMHGTMQLDADHNAVTITGRLNWSTLIILAGSELIALSFISPLFNKILDTWIYRLLFAAVPIVLTLFLYLIQASRYNRLGKIISS